MEATAESNLTMRRAKTDGFQRCASHPQVSLRITQPDKPSSAVAASPVATSP